MPSDCERFLVLVLLRTLTLECHRTVDLPICLLSYGHEYVSQTSSTVQVRIRVCLAHVPVDEVFKVAVLESVKGLPVLNECMKSRENLRDKTIILELKAADQASHHLAAVNCQ